MLANKDAKTTFYTKLVLNTEAKDLLSYEFNKPV